MCVADSRQRDMRNECKGRIDEGEKGGEEEEAKEQEWRRIKRRKDVLSKQKAIKIGQKLVSFEAPIDNCSFTPSQKAIFRCEYES